MIIRSLSLKTIVIIIILLLPFTLSVISISQHDGTKDIYCKEHSGSSVLFVGDFCYFNLTLNVDAEKVCIIFYYGDLIPDLENRSIKNYYRWEYDNGIWLDNSGHSSFFIDSNQCIKKNNSYSFYIKVDNRAKPGRWNIKVLIDDEEVENLSNSYIFVAQFNLFFTAIIGIYEPINNDRKILADIELFDSQKHKMIAEQKENINNIVDNVIDKSHHKKRDDSKDKQDIIFFSEKKPYFKEELIKSSISTYHKSKLKQNIKHKTSPFFLKSSGGGGKNNFFTAKKSFSFQRILALFTVIIFISLSFVPIINTQDIKVSSSLNISTFTLYPDKIYKNDSILLNVSVSDSNGIDYVVAEINGYEKINMNFVEGDVVNNTIYSGFWQDSWIAHNISPGYYYIEITAYGVENCSISRQSFFRVLQDNITYEYKTPQQNITRPENNSHANKIINNNFDQNISNLSELNNSKIVQHINDTVYIVDKKHEKMHILPGTRFFVERTINGPHGTRIVFVPMFSDELTLESVEIIDEKENITDSNISSICETETHVFESGNARCKKELDIQQKKETLDENIKELNKIAYVDDVVLQSPRTIRMWFRAPSWEEIQKNKKVTSGEISYLVFSYDINGSLDFEGSTWWNINWLYRKEINVTTGANYPYNGYDGYTVKFSGLDTTNTSKFQADGDDIRIVYWNGVSGVELDREIRNIGTINTTIIFRLQADIAANDYDNNYSLYYGNSDVGAGPSNQSNIYLWYDNASIDRESQYIQGRIDSSAHGGSWADSISWNSAGYYNFDTGDNYADSFRPSGLEERDIYVEYEQYQTAAYPTDMTSGPIVRWNGTGSGGTEDSSHWYYFEMADSAYQGGSYGSHDDITADTRGSVVITNGNLGAFPQTTWTRLGISSWGINPTNINAYYNNESGGWNGSRFSGTHASGSDNENIGDFGLWLQQDAGRFRNIIARRYIEPEPVLIIGEEEIDTTVDPIVPYTITYAPFSITATGPINLDNVTLWYRFSTDNLSWDNWLENDIDSNVPWNWSFNFPNGTGYYEFYSIGKLTGTSDETSPSTADTICYFNSSLNTPPTIDLIYPSPNGTTGVNIQPVCNIWVNDSDGDDLNVSWYENSTGVYVLRNLNISVSANSSISYIFSEFSNYETSYWWKVSVNDTIDNISSIYYFSTGPIDTSVNSISPYGVTTSPKTITASGSSDLDSVSLWYRWSDDNSSWGDHSGEVGYDSIVIDNVASESDNSGVSSMSWSHTVSSDLNNSVLIVCTNVEDDDAGNNYFVDSVDFNGDALSRAVRDAADEGFSAISEIWYLLNPDVGSFTVTVNFSQVVNNALGGSVSFSGVNQSAPDDTGSSIDTGSPSGLATSVLSDVNGSLIVSVATDGMGDYVYSYGSAQSEIYNVAGSTHEGAGSFRIPFGSGSFVMHTNLSSASNRMSQVVAVWSPSSFLWGNSSDWIEWVNVSNPDSVFPWAWNFDFPNGTGFYEFYSIGNKSGSVEEAPPVSADSRCYYNPNGTPPSIDLVSPAPNGTSNVNIKPICQIWANDSNGDNLTVDWYENTTGSWVLRNTNNSVSANSIVSYQFSEFSNYSSTYWWKVTVNDSKYNISEFFYFSTGLIQTSVNTIIPYEVTTAIYPITASGPSDLDEVTLYYRWSSDNTTWGTRSVSIFEDFESGSQNSSLWNTYQTPAGDARIQWNYGTAHSGSYSCSMDDFDTDTGDAALNVIYTNYDFTGATDINIDFWQREWGDEPEDAPDSWAGWGNYDVVAFTNDGNTWYEIVPESSLNIESFTNYQYNISADPDFSSSPTSSFAIAFQQYDNYQLTFDGRAWDDIYINFTIKDETNSTDWIKWSNTSNPDRDSPWGWSFDFPNGTGYYEFYSIGNKSGSVEEVPPVSADSRCYFNLSAPQSPLIQSYDLINITGSKLNNASGLLDVNNEYAFIINISDSNGWENIDYINITAWYDNGNEGTVYNQTNGGNLNMFLQYENITGVANWTMHWPDDEVELIIGNCSETIITPYKRAIRFSFKPLSQICWASSNGTWDSSINTTNDPYSWNFNISVVDSENFNTWINDEYGIYKFTSHFPDNDWVDVYAAPGFSDTSNIVKITYSSNYNFNMSLYFEENLFNSTYGYTIPVANNVKILESADPNDDIFSDITFLGIGEANSIDIFNDSGIFHKNNVSQTVNVQFEIYVPIGTFSVKYKARVATKVIQK